MSEMDTLRAENERLRAELVAERSAATTRRTGLVEPTPNMAVHCGAQCEHAGFCTEAPDHGGRHSASGLCSW